MQLNLMAAYGGLMIGAAAMLLLLANGRIAGISGILWEAVTNYSNGFWRHSFLLGLPLGALLYHTLSGSSPPTPNPASGWFALLAGLLVGIGVRLGSGCTSGHGVCGLGRRSLRSLVATLTFMGTGIVTVYLLRHVLGGGL